MEDKVFKNTVIQMRFAESEKRFETGSVLWAFVESRGTDEIRRFIIGVFMCSMDKGWVKNHAKKWPKGFWVELAYAALKGVEKRESYEELSRRYLIRLGDGGKGGIDGGLTVMVNCSSSDVRHALISGDGKLNEPIILVVRCIYNSLWLMLSVSFFNLSPRHRTPRSPHHHIVILILKTWHKCPICLYN